jgi:hypothetical protein
VKDTLFTKALEEVIEEDMKAIDAVIEEDIEVLAELGNPEKLIGKPYEEWTPQDIQQLKQVYGNDETLNKFMFNKEYKEVLAMEAELKER